MKQYEYPFVCLDKIIWNRTDSHPDPSLREEKGDRPKLGRWGESN
jgi:hypothetical protein